jgi:hypothetical protein
MMRINRNADSAASIVRCVHFPGQVDLSMELSSLEFARRNILDNSLRSDVLP